MVVVGEEGEVFSPYREHTVITAPSSSVDERAKNAVNGRFYDSIFVGQTC